MKSVLGLKSLKIDSLLHKAAKRYSFDTASTLQAVVETAIRAHLPVALLPKLNAKVRQGGK